jgi:EF hand domain-containing protein
VALTTGCNSGPARLQPPGIDADDAAAEALEMYDSDGDGLIAGAELTKANGLQAAMKTLDTDGDGKVSALEIAARIRSWQASKAGISSILCYVTLDGKPLEGATVTFEPESFLGEEVQTAIGPTNFNGVAAPYIPKEKRPTPDMPPGLQLGFYRVKVSKVVNGQETIPAKYNAETILGQQVANDDPAILRHRVELKLDKR